MSNPRITKRQVHCHFRLRVPGDLVAIFAKRELHRSLQVSTPREARTIATTLSRCGPQSPFVTHLRCSAVISTSQM